MTGLWKHVLGRVLPALLVVSAAGAGWSMEPAKKILYFTKSSGFQHSVVARKKGQPAWSEKILVELGKKNGYEIECSKDGRIFSDPDKLKQYAAVISYATGDWTKPGTDKQPPITPEGKKALLDAVANGMGFVGIHAGNDAFRIKGNKPDPYIAMLGGEFKGHGKQQKARNTVVSPDFPGMKNVGKGFELQEEWYVPTKLADDLHVILVQETEGMEGPQYQIPPYPATWARMHGKGKVFYTSLGHREDVWTNPLFQGILINGIKWAVGDVDYRIEPNIKKVTPGALKVLRAVK